MWASSNSEHGVFCVGRDCHKLEFCKIFLILVEASGYHALFILILFMWCLFGLRCRLLGLTALSSTVVMSSQPLSSAAGSAGHYGDNGILTYGV